MTWLTLPSDFTRLPLSLKVEQKFGLAGVVRLIKVLELLAVSPGRAHGTVELPLSDWQDALQLGGVLLLPFLVYLAKAEWLSLEHGDEPGAPLRVTLLDPAAYLPVAVEPELFTKAEQWRAWCAHELAFPPSLGTDPYVQQLYRRWCASNVTVSEMQAAVLAAMSKTNSLDPQALHAELALIRKGRMAQAA